VAVAPISVSDHRDKGRRAPMLDTIRDAPPVSPGVSDNLLVVLRLESQLHIAKFELE
jgi:hypothetical protein